jgi:inner membrane transporter RhtA
VSTPRFSPVWLVLVGILSVQFGAVVSKGQFDEIPPVGMVFLRLVTSSLILLAFVRPRLRRRPIADWRPVLALGFVLGAMNWAFYESFARIPLGGAVTIEFAGPLLLAAVGSRRLRDMVWVGLAALGVTLFGAGPTKVDAVGFGLALLAGGCWALYVLSTAATGRRWAGVEGLAVASTIATLAIAPFAVVAAGERLLEPRLLALGALVGLLSSLIPYSLEMVALRTLPPRVFGILMSLDPAAAALAAAVLLSEWLTPLQLLAIACVTAASVGAARTQSAPAAVPATDAHPAAQTHAPSRRVRDAVPDQRGPTYPAGRSAQGGQEGWAELHDGEGVRGHAAGVEAAGRGERGVDDEPGSL